MSLHRTHDSKDTAASAAMAYSRDVSETPVTHVSGKITTPPRSTTSKRSRAALDTPVRIHDNMGHTLMLSPAFSSPQPPSQPVFDVSSVASGAYIAPSAAIDSSSFMQAARVTKSFSDEISEPFSDSFSDSFGETSSSFLSQELHSHKPKKQKKGKREPREANFSLASSEKPPYSYAMLIGMAILSHSEKQLTLSQVYSWISETFKYYRREDVGWQNSIRHNLSLNKAFVKGAKSKDGKGHFWCVQPESEDLFLKAKNSSKKSSYHEVMDQLAEASQQSRAACSPSSHSSHSSHPPIPSSPTAPAVATDDDSKGRPFNQEVSASHWARDRGSLNPPDTAHRPAREPLANTTNAVLRTPSRIKCPSGSPERPLLAGKHLGFTSSFSCSSSFALSPLSHLETGPLLEPLEPLSPSRAAAAQNPGNMSVQLPSISVSKAGPPIPQLQPPMTGSSTPRAAGTARTPKSTAKTPLHLLRTPLSGAMIYKLTYSPSYLEEFYHSPFGAGRAVLNSYDDDDMLMRAFDSPAAARPARPSLAGELAEASDDTRLGDGFKGKK